jgi:hypothetical protein
MAALQVLQRGDERSINDALAALSPLIPDTCASTPRSFGPVTLHAPTPDIEASPSEFGNRIIYTIGWRRGAVALGPSDEKNDGSVTPLVAVRSADAVLKLNPGEPIDGIGDRIVVIGGSYSDSGDWHMTPIGAMPGALIAINAIHNLIEYGTPAEPTEPWRSAIALALVIVVALLFSLLRPLLAGLAATLVTLLLLIVSIPWFKSGVILDLAIPSFGVVAHNLVISATDVFQNLWRHGWRWLLRPRD